MFRDAEKVRSTAPGDVEVEVDLFHAKPGVNGGVQGEVAGLLGFEACGYEDSAEEQEQDACSAGSGDGFHSCQFSY